MKYYKVGLVLLTIAFVMAACSKIESQAGPAGRAGNDGAPGATGPRGADGTTITLVQLCPGVTTYPGVFVELAECINNKLYGVYSANNGFLTELPPGRYSSNAIGSACNLTIEANCIVTQ